MIINQVITSYLFAYLRSYLGRILEGNILLQLGIVQFTLEWQEFNMCTLVNQSQRHVSFSTNCFFFTQIMALIRIDGKNQACGDLNTTSNLFLKTHLT